MQAFCSILIKDIIVERLEGILDNPREFVRMFSLDFITVVLKDVEIFGNVGSNGFGCIFVIKVEGIRNGNVPIKG